MRQALLGGFACFKGCQAYLFKNNANTLIYAQLVEFEGDEYCSAVAHNVEEAQKLVEAGFENVCDHENMMLFRRRK